MIKYGTFLKKIARKQDIYNQKKLHYFSAILSSRVSYWFYNLKFTANFVLLLFLSIGILSSICLYFEFFIISYILYRIHIILDICDGNLARAYNVFNNYAPGIDKIAHFIINNSFLILINFKINFNLDILFLVITYNLSYLFSIFFHHKVRVNFLDNRKNQILKDLISLEGYIFISILFLIFNLDINFYFVNLFYIFTFSLIFLVKFNNKLMTDK